MSGTGLRVILAAEEAAGARTLRLLEKSPHHLVAVAAKPVASDAPSGASPTLLERAAAAGAATFDSRMLRTADIVPELRELAPDVLLNVHSLYKVHPAVVEVFSVGAWNLHPGPLPEAAGINVPSWAIADGFQEHGVTVHAMTENYDEGAIAYEERFPLRDGATGLTLSAECATRGLGLIRSLIQQLADDPSAVPHITQDLTAQRYYGLGQPNDGVIDWQQAASKIEAHVRAADFRPFEGPWKPPKACVGGELIGLVKVQVGDEVAPGTQAGQLAVFDGRTAVAADDRWVHLVETEQLPRCDQETAKV